MTTTRWSNLYPTKNLYPDVMDEMIAACGGLGVEVKMSNTRMKELLPHRPTSAIGDIRRAAAITGALEVRFEGNRSDANEVGLGLKAFWTWVHDSKWMENVLKDAYGLRFTAWDLEQHLKRADVKQEAISAGAVIVKEEDGVTTVGEEPDQTLKQLFAPVRKSDAEALIEATRQYAGREAFIEEELARFHAMGIEIDRTAIKFSRDEVLETMTPLVAYIDTLKSAIERQGQAVRVVQDNKVSQEKYDDLQKTTDRLRAERALERKATEKYKSDLLARTQAAERRARQLEDEVTRLATAHLKQVGMPTQQA